jgi:hypothetical protein
MSETRSRVSFLEGISSFRLISEELRGLGGQVHIAGLQKKNRPVEQEFPKSKVLDIIYRKFRLYNFTLLLPSH